MSNTGAQRSMRRGIGGGVCSVAGLMLLVRIYLVDAPIWGPAISSAVLVIAGLWLSIRGLRETRKSDGFRHGVALIVVLVASGAVAAYVLVCVAVLLYVLTYSQGTGGG